MKETVDITQIEAAAARLKGHALVTPLHENIELNQRVGARVLLKLENLQISGSFKFRGAYNRLSQLDAAGRKQGVVAWSSGNHAQGIAAAGKLLGVAAKIVMPHDAPKIKVENTRAWGAEIVFYDRRTEDRERIGRDLADRLGAVLVPSYDDIDIIAGQGTVGLEAACQAAALGCTIDVGLICCGGGGLAAGTATALRNAQPSARLFTVEPDACDDTLRSLKAGRIMDNVAGATSICDALLASHPGTLTFPILQRTGCQGLSVSDEEVTDAMHFAFDKLKTVIEPGGAVALAAALSGKADIKGKTVLVVVSGGNVDHADFSKHIGRP